MDFHGIDICCPKCRGDLQGDGRETLSCAACDHRYPVILGIPDLRIFPDPYIDMDADRAKGRKIAAQLEQTDFPGLIDYYYSHTDVVPAAHAALYKRGLLAAGGRAAAALDGWEEDRQPPADSDTGGAFLEIGCGTGPLLLAAADRYRQVVGIDIAFRWLVMGKKRLAEAGREIPLICACAEALPFADTCFDTIAADSVLEVVVNQEQAAAEAHRVLKPGGCFYINTPNRFSLGPDPHAGILFSGLIPEKKIAAIVERQGGIAPKRTLLSKTSLQRLLRNAGLQPGTIRLPDIPAAQRAHFGAPLRLAIDLYQLVKRLPLLRQLMLRIGPLLQTTARRPAAGA